jgi:6-phosphogluconate dehydrogenase (decarboxylating)
MMQLGMIGLGRMGANMVRRLMRNGHQCVVFDRNATSVKDLEKEGAVGTSSLDDFVAKLTMPRPVWLMVPAGVVDNMLTELGARLKRGDIIIDGGNSYYIDDIRRSRELEAKGVHYVDVGTSGGVWGLERGYCQMIGARPMWFVVWTQSSRRSHQDEERFRARRGVRRAPPGPPRKAICIAGITAPGTSSRWYTTGSSTA